MKGEVKKVLYGRQEGCCNGCGGHFSYDDLTIDHKKTVGEWWQGFH